MSVKSMEKLREESEESMESTERAKLRELEESGLYVFHGSGVGNIDAFEPRQAYHHTKEGEKIPDDKPAVFTSPFADIAIFMSIFNLENFSNFRSGFTFQPEGIEFHITKETMDEISTGKHVKGYVYVFSKDKFTYRNDSESISYDGVEPIEVIEVTERDLPKDIIVKDF